MKKSVKAEFEKRIYEIYSLILQGADRAKLVKYASEQWQVGRRQTDHYISLAKQWIENYVSKDRDAEFNHALARRDHLLFKAFTKEDIGLCHEILKDMDKLRGFYPAEKSKSEVTVKTDNRASVDLLTKPELVADVRKVFRDHEPKSDGSAKS